MHASIATPYEVTLVEKTFDACLTKYLPKKVIGDRAYDLDKLDKKLAYEWNVELTAPHKSNLVRQSTHEDRKVRGYKH